MNKKASLELSMNFIVMLIMALVIFSMGMFFLFKIIMPEVDEISGTLDEKTQEDINRILLQSGSKVAFPKNKIEIKKGDHEMLGIGIKNDLEDKEHFKFIIECQQAYTLKDQEPICGPNAQEACDCEQKKCCQNWIINRNSDIQIDKNSHEIYGLFIKVPKDAKSGQYFYSIQVEASATQGGSYDSHDTPKKFYVIAR